MKSKRSKQWHKRKETQWAQAVLEGRHFDALTLRHQLEATLLQGELGRIDGVRFVTGGKCETQ